MLKLNVLILFLLSKNNTKEDIKTEAIEVNRIKVKSGNKYYFINFNK